MFTIVDRESLLAQRRTGTHPLTVRYQVGGEMKTIPARLQDGQVLTSGEIANLGSISSLTNIEQLTGRMALDVEIGREQVPLLYKSIYDLMSDANFPASLEAKWALRGVVVWLQVLELEEIKYGHLEAELGPSVPILTYAAMLAVTKQMIDFNASWDVSLASKAFGEAFNALMNHLHLSPILDFNYQAANISGFVAAAEGSPDWVGVYHSLAAGIKAADGAKRTPTVLLASRVNKMVIEQAIKGGQVSGTVLPPLSIDTIVYYDGWTDVVRGKTVSYAGVGTTYGYLIRPKRGFKELIKRDMTIEQVAGDPSRMVDTVWRGHAYRGVFAAVEENVQRVQLVADQG